jgi:EAL domain-containing protein (putative c-di-GMP-specific phosphodiesterase class I)
VGTFHECRSNTLSLDCAFAQGFHFYRPMSPEAVGALLDSTIALAAG